MGVNNDKFSLISQLDRNCKFIIKTPCGQTKEITFADLILQGSVFGSLKCSVQIDSLGRDVLSDSEGLGVYIYKDSVEIPPICIVDDIIGISECNINAVELNALINSKIESKSLELNQEKCFKLHLSKPKEKNKSCHNTLKVHDETMREASKVKYLGDFLNAQGNNNDTINDRVNRAIGIKSQISSLLQSLSLGSYYFEIAMILRESMFLNSILVNSETWYGVNKRQIELLEAADVRLFEVFFKSHSKTVRNAYFAETGLLKINHIMSKRRLMFLQMILKRNDSDLLKKVYLAQSLRTCKNDWWKLVNFDKTFYNINLSDDQISKMSKGLYKKVVEEKIYIKASEEILSSKKSKMQKILENVKCNKKGKIVTQSYLKSNKLTPSEKQTLFELRVFNFQTKSNFKSQFEDDMTCRICLEKDSYEDENHTFLECSVLLENIEINKNIKFDDVFGCLDIQVKAIKYFMRIIQKRNAILESRKKQV